MYHCTWYDNSGYKKIESRELTNHMLNLVSKSDGLPYPTTTVLSHFKTWKVMFRSMDSRFVLTAHSNIQMPEILKEHQKLRYSNSKYEYKTEYLEHSTTFFGWKHYHNWRLRNPFIPPHGMGQAVKIPNVPYTTHLCSKYQASCQVQSKILLLCKAFSIDWSQFTSSFISR